MAERFLKAEIRDNGIGIPRQELAHVFERFYTVGNLDEHCSGSHFRATARDSDWLW